MTNSDTAPLIVAHRGASSVAPENTIIAFRKAIELGVDGIEMDVRLAADGVPVVIHDRDLKRTAGRNVRVSELTSAELSLIDVGSWFEHKRSTDESFANERVATLRQVLASINDFKGMIYVELKCDTDEIMPLANAVHAEITTADVRERSVVKSFRLSFVPYFRQLDPQIRVAALFAPKIRNILRKEKHLVKLAAEFGSQELSLHYSLATRKTMKKAAKYGLPVTIWTVDHPRWIKRSLDRGYHAVITNDPQTLIEARRECRASDYLK